MFIMATPLEPTKHVADSRLEFGQFLQRWWRNTSFNDVIHLCIFLIGLRGHHTVMSRIKVSEYKLILRGLGGVSSIITSDTLDDKNGPCKGPSIAMPSLSSASSVTC